jgi:CO/xanthine dehydrogenase Mo-binding subunit
MAVVTQYVGAALPRVDGVDKVTGRAVYTADVKREAVLWGKVLHSSYAHARILSIDASAARALPGVFAVLSGADLGEANWGSFLKDLPILARDRVRFAGERVAAVAAIDADTAQQALDLIEVEYEELPAVFDIEAAMTPEAPILHPEFNNYTGVTDNPQPGRFGGFKTLEQPSNVYTRRTRDRGDVEAGFAAADVILENTYSTQRVHQGYLEPQTCLVDIDASDGRIHVWTASKMPHGSRTNLAAAIGVPREQVLVHPSTIGGDFGGKGNSVLVPIAYHLAKRTGRPVRMMNSYQEELLAGNPRHSTLIRLRSGVKKDGTLTAHHVQFFVNCGAYAAFKPGGTIFGPEQAAGPYRIANSRIESAHVYTNTIPGGYMRGPGESQAVFALESHIDEVARAIDMDPLEFRRRNLVREGDETAFGVTFDGVRAVETLEAAATAIGYDTPKRPNVGRGLAVGERPAGGGVGNASITFQPDGTVVVGTAIFEQGSGTYTILLQIVADELQLPLERLQLDIWTTDGADFDSGVAGSWAARVNTGAIHDAVEAGRGELLAWVGQRLGWDAGALTLRGDEVLNSAFEERIAWRELLEESGESITGRATHSAGAGELAHVTSFAAQAAEVEVDPETGQVKLLRLVTAHDVGRVLNPIGHQGQINGGAVQGIGYAFMEQLVLDDGRVTNLSLGDYKLPTIRDLPQLDTVLLPGEAGLGPYNIKAIGEVPTTPVAPAIANAIADATGARIRDLPITAEKVYRALDKTKSVTKAHED